MQKSKIILGLFIVTTICISCSDRASKSPNKVKRPNFKTVKFYTYDHSTSVFTWTAYKTSEKVGVKGTFKDIKVSGVEESKEIYKTLEGLKFEVLIPSLFSNDATGERDPKIIKYFFGITENLNKLKAHIKSLKINQYTGTALISIYMNGIERDVDLKYTQQQNTITLLGEIELNDWNMQKAVSNLNKKCELLHKGTDGKSKLWSTVSIELKTIVKEL